MQNRTRTQRIALAMLTSSQSKLTCSTCTGSYGNLSPNLSLNFIMKHMHKSIKQLNTKQQTTTAQQQPSNKVLKRKTTRFLCTQNTSFLTQKQDISTNKKVHMKLEKQQPKTDAQSSKKHTHSSQTEAKKQHGFTPKKQHVFNPKNNTKRDWKQTTEQLPSSSKTGHKTAQKNSRNPAF